MDKFTTFYVRRTHLSLFREYPDPKVKKVITVTSVLPALWDLRVYPAHRYVIAPKATASMTPLIVNIPSYAISSVGRAILG